MTVYSELCEKKHFGIHKCNFIFSVWKIPATNKKDLNNSRGFHVRDLIKFGVLFIECSFLGVFAKIAKKKEATISFDMSVRLSACPSVRVERAQLPLDRFSRNMTFGSFPKICREKFEFY